MWDVFLGYIIESFRQRRSEKRAEKERLRDEEQYQIESCYQEINDNLLAVIHRAERLEHELFNDPIDNLDITYTEYNGFDIKPVNIKSGPFEATMTFDTVNFEDKTSFTPSRFDSDYASIEILDVCFTKWGTIIAIKVINHQKYHNIPSNWCDDVNGRSMYIIDVDNNDYLYPVSSTMRGEVVFDYPKIELIAFSPFREPTNAFNLYISNVPVYNISEGSGNLVFKYSSDDLYGNIEQKINMGTITDQLLRPLAEEKEKLKKKVFNKGKSRYKYLFWFFFVFIFPLFFV